MGQTMNAQRICIHPGKQHLITPRGCEVRKQCELQVNTTGTGLCPVVGLVLAALNLQALLPECLFMWNSAD